MAKKKAHKGWGYKPYITLESLFAFIFSLFIARKKWSDKAESERIKRRNECYTALNLYSLSYLFPRLRGRQRRIKRNERSECRFRRGISYLILHTLFALIPNFSNAALKARKGKIGMKMSEKEWRIRRILSVAVKEDIKCVTGKLSSFRPNLAFNRCFYRRKGRRTGDKCD